MYHKAIMFSVQDMWDSLQPQDVVAVPLEPYIASVQQNIQEGEFQELSWPIDTHQDDIAFDTLIARTKTIVPQGVTTLTMQENLGQQLWKYDLPFNRLPPGRRLLIWSIDVDAPIVDVPYASDDKLQNGDFDAELTQWVVKYPFTSMPWQEGNGLLFGHSSVSMREEPDNPFGYVFYKLTDLNQWDTFDIIWDGQLYSYVIEEKVIKDPEDVAAEIEKHDNKWEFNLTLMACYPRFTDLQRSLVRARQVNVRS